ncbi:unnamed protein product [Pipistrellus nathusii]|uniref:Uncharacterized protein n=1 Tax=Pipistrellus nathusii TaxID=59473 RepID=A0ABN9ZS58_PIPNA
METTTPGSAQERKLTVSFKISELCNCYVIIWKADAATARGQGKTRAPLDSPAPGRGSLVVLPPPVAGRRLHRRLEGRWLGREDSENAGFEPGALPCPYIQISGAVSSGGDGPSLGWL